MSFTLAALAGTFDNHVEYRVIKENGEIAYVRAHGAAMRDAMGQPEKVIGLVQDITQENLAEQALHDSKDMVQKKHQLISFRVVVQIARVLHPARLAKTRGSRLAKTPAGSQTRQNRRKVTK